MGLRDRMYAAMYVSSTRRAEDAWVGAVRTELLADLTGRVLEVGAGAGANLPHYRKASQVLAVEPSPAMRARLSAKVGESTVPVEIVYGKAEALPGEDGEFDAVVCTLVLCSVRDPARAAAELRRTLRPGGRLMVLEHVRGVGRAGRWQDRLDPVWSRLTGGCHCNRRTADTLRDVGFDVSGLRTFRPVPNNLLTTPLIRGEAS